MSSGQQSCQRIAVLGAGIVGLATATRLLEVSGDSIATNIVIIAERFLEETTSDGAGGLFRPDDRFMQGVSPQTAKYFHIFVFSFLSSKIGHSHH